MEHSRHAISKPQYQAHIARIQDYILAGDCYQVNYAQRFEAALEGDAWSAYGYVRTLLTGGFSVFYARQKTMRFSHFLQSAS